MLELIKFETRGRGSSFFFFEDLFLYFWQCRSSLLRAGSVVAVSRDYSCCNAWASHRSGCYCL